MKKYRIASEIEWQILKYLWDTSPATVKNVWINVFPNKERAYTTVQTYMERLTEKGILEKEKIGLVNFYQPIISEKRALDEATKGFVSRAFDGSFISLANHLVNSGSLTHDEIQGLKDLLEKKEGNRSSTKTKK